MTNSLSLLELFLTSLQALSPVQAAAAVEGEHAVVAVLLGGNSIHLRTEARKRVYPRDVQQWIWRMRELTPHSKSRWLPVLLAEALSTGAKELLRTEGMGYFDRGGSLFLPAPNAYLYIDKSVPKDWERAVGSLFSERRSRVLQVLLAHHLQWHGVKELARRARVAASTASEVLAELERFDWVAVQGRGPKKERQLHDPGQLLDAWVMHLKSEGLPKLRRFFVPGVKAEELMIKVAQVFGAHEVPYAVTHEAAAQHYAPYLSSVSQVRARVMSGSNLEAALGELGAREVDQGMNLALIESKTAYELRFRLQNAGVRLATPLRVYLDLICSEGRAPDMAAHLRETMLHF